MQALELLPAGRDPAAAEPTLKQESSLLTLLEEHSGHLTFSVLSPEQITSNTFLHLAHSYSNIGKVTTSTLLPIGS